MNDGIAAHYTIIHNLPEKYKRILTEKLSFLSKILVDNARVFRLVEACRNLSQFAVEVLTLKKEFTIINIEIKEGIKNGFLELFCIFDELGHVFFFCGQIYSEIMD